MQGKLSCKSGRRQRTSRLVFLLVLGVSMVRLAGIVAAVAAQEPGDRVELAPHDVTAERLIELLAPPGGTRGLAVGARRQQQRPQCKVFHQRLTRGITVPAVSPIPTIPIQFAFNSAAITESAAQTLDEIGKALASPQLAASCFRIEGHTDSIGSDRVNDRLSQRRAEAAVRYLASKFGIEPQRLAAIGRGRRSPVADNDTDAGRQRNRRVEIVNMGSGEAGP